MLFIGGTETFLDARQIGLERVSSCFYRKQGDKSRREPAQRTAATLSRV